MNKEEYVNFVNAYTIDEERVNRIEELYGVNEIPELLKKIISVAGEVTFFDEEKRALTFEGIIYANKDLDVDFNSKRMIPVIDAYDLNYIVYIIDQNKWGIFNIADDDVYDDADELIDLL